MTKTILTCALTGSEPLRRNSAVPVTPEQIARSGVEAAQAGAAILHVHVRDPATGGMSMETALYREVVERIRDSGCDAIISLTTGNGAIFSPSQDDPKVAGPGTTLVPWERRVEHVVAIRPEMCSLDLGTLWLHNFAFINIPDHITQMARAIQSASTLPELECFDTGDLALARHLIAQDVLKPPYLFQFALGLSFGMPASALTLELCRAQIPHDAVWAAFGIGPESDRMLARAFLAGGHVRCGFEDNHYIERGMFAPSNAALVQRARSIVELLGGELATPVEARAQLGIRQS